MMADVNNFQTPISPTWCPGCGNFGIFTALKNSFTKQNLTRDDLLLLYDIGCSGNMADFLGSYGMHTLHGRVVSVAIGAHLAHHQFPILAIGGDGGVYGEGVEHFLEACRGNFNITALVHNNGLYSLTTGQRSPTAEKGKKTKSTPFGVIENPFKPLETAIIHDAGFVARGYALDIPHLTDLITEAMHHSGFALIDVLQPCVTFNPQMSPQWYEERIYKLDSFKGLSAHEALEKLTLNQTKLVTGVLYRSQRPAYHTLLPQLKEGPLLHQSIETIDLQSLIKDFQ